MGGIKNILHCDGLRWHDINISSLVKIGTGVQVVFRFCLRNLRGYNVGNIDGREL
jgi:hypothetical protein